MRNHFLHLRNRVTVFRQQPVQLLPRVPVPALARDELVVPPLLVVHAQLAHEHLQEVDVLLLEVGALGPLAVPLPQLVLQDEALLDIQYVVLRVEDRDLVHEGERILHDAHKIDTRRHDTHGARFYTVVS